MTAQSNHENDADTQPPTLTLHSDNTLFNDLPDGLRLRYPDAGVQRSTVDHLSRKILLFLASSGYNAEDADSRLQLRREAVKMALQGTGVLPRGEGHEQAFFATMPAVEDKIERVSDQHMWGIQDKHRLHPVMQTTDWLEYTIHNPEIAGKLSGAAAILLEHYGPDAS